MMDEELKDKQIINLKKKIKNLQEKMKNIQNKDYEIPIGKKLFIKTQDRQYTGILIKETDTYLKIQVQDLKKNQWEYIINKKEIEAIKIFADKFKGEDK